MTDITHKALMERGFGLIVAHWHKEVGKHDFFYDLKNHLLWIKKGPDQIRIPNRLSLADLDNLIKLFV